MLLCGAQESPLDSGNIPVKVALLYVAEVLVLRYTCLLYTSMPGLIPEDEAIVAEAQAMIEAAIAKL